MGVPTFPLKLKLTLMSKNELLNKEKCNNENLVETVNQNVYEDLNRDMMKKIIGGNITNHEELDTPWEDN